MLKFGIWQRNKFLATPPAGQIAALFHRLSRSRVSLHLLSVPEEPSAEDVSLFEKLMPYVRLSGGVYRTTYRQRFRALNPIVNRILVETFPSSERLRFEDWAASDCLTSAEWAQELFAFFPRLEFVASDLLLFLLEVRKENSEKRFIVEPDGNPLQYVSPPFVVRLSHPESKLFPLSWLLARSGRRSWEALRRSLTFPKSSALDGEIRVRSEGYRLKKLPLVHPEALQLARKDARFAIRSHSAFDTSDQGSHVIRTMNIYNRAYFSEERLRDGTRAVVGSLVPGGIWIVGRTKDDRTTQHNVTILRKQDSGFLEVVERIGEGSEIEALAISSAKAPPQVIIAS